MCVCPRSPPKQNTLAHKVPQQNASSTTNAHIITIDDALSAPTVETINPMSFPRIFANGVVLPTGHVLITGGQDFGAPFSDNGSALPAELWDPVTEAFTPVAPISIPRNYHSIGLLLPDATVLNAGGGLCGACAGNHYDGQIYSPGYLFDEDGDRAVRPVIESADAVVAVGGNLTATTDSPVDAWALLRLGSTTRRFSPFSSPSPPPSPHLPHPANPTPPLFLPHTDTVNTDQRRIPLTFTTTDNTTYTMPLPADSGILIPGYYYLFAINAAGVPSVASFVEVPVEV